jgi:uncharacterized repeat protein (TIGR01451 family)
MKSMSEGFNSNFWRRLRTVSILIMLVAVLGVFADSRPQNAHAANGGGPVALIGIDAEDGGPNGHGPIATWIGVVNNFISQVTNGGTNILVIGGGKNAGDNVTTFWDAVDAGVAGHNVVYVNGAAGIAAQSFAGFAMIVVVSSVAETPFGGLTQAENDALAARQVDIAAFVNAGGGLFGLSQSGLTNPYAYIAAVGAVTNEFTDYQDITATPQGLALGINDTLDVCCWHDEYVTFPSFLQVLATNNEEGAHKGHIAAIGGQQVVIGGPDLTVTKNPKPNQPAAVRGGTFSYIIKVRNVGNQPTPSSPNVVKVVDTLPAGTSFVFWWASQGRCMSTGPTVECDLGGGLAPGGEITIEIRVRLPQSAGTITNSVRVDPLNRIQESNETNNSASYQFVLP